MLFHTFRHARKYFNGVDEDQFSEVQHVMGLLAFSSHTEVASYQVSWSLALACRLTWRQPPATSLKIQVMGVAQLVERQTRDPNT